MSTDTMMSDPWSMEVTPAGGGGTYELPPAGTHMSAVVGLFHVGHHYERRKDKETGKEYDAWPAKMVVCLELAVRKSDGTPHVVAMMVGASMNENSWLYSLVRSLTGRAYAQGEKVDPREILGKPCLTEITHKEGTTERSKGKTYANVTKVSGMPQGIPPYTCTIPTVAWHVAHGKPADMPWLPRVYGRTINEIADDSRERRGNAPLGARTSEQVRAAGEAVAAKAAKGPGDSDIPF